MIRAGLAGWRARRSLVVGDQSTSTAHVDRTRPRSARWSAASRACQTSGPGEPGPSLRLRDETILLISPQSWEHIAISKHHYARELARRGNRVFFLDPPAPDLAAPLTVDEIPGAPGLAVVRYRPMFPFELRFHARAVYDRLVRLQVRRIRRAIGVPIDITWCFDVNLFTDLRQFGAPMTIYHPVDLVREPCQIRPATSADVVLGVSSSLLEAFGGLGTPTCFVNHGLGEEFVREARQAHAERSTADHSAVRIGYAGNLVNPVVSRSVLRTMIAQHPDAEFHFWGPCEVPAYMGRVSPDIPAFIDFLRGAPNVRLHGPTPSAVLAREMQSIDVFLLAYSPSTPTYDCSNSHKILEYLSTGKVTVSSRISTYADRGDLLVMPEDGDNDKLPALLDQVLERLDELNAPACEARRRAFALDHTYGRQVDRIAELLSSVSARA